MATTSSSYDDLRLRIANLRSELASAEALLERRRIERRRQSSRSASTVVVTRVAKRRRAVELRRLAAVLVAGALLGTALVVASVHALTPPARAVPAARVHVPAVVVVPAAPEPAAAPERALDEKPRVAEKPAVAAPVVAAPVLPKPAASGTGGLTVVCLPKCDSILDNGVERGPGHLFNRPVTAGRHVLVLRAGDVARTLVVDVEPDATREVRVAMEPSKYGF